MNHRSFDGAESLLWTCEVDWIYPGKVRDESGRPLYGFKVKTHKKTRLVSIVFNGNFEEHYRFPIHPKAVIHPMVKWANLPMCGIPIFDQKGISITTEERILEAVLLGEKPVGDLMYLESDVEAIAQAEYLAKGAGLVVFKYTRSEGDGRTCLMVGVDQPLEKLFDLKSISDYYAEGVNARQDFFLETLTDVGHLTPAQALRTYNWSTPATCRQLVLTGLCLGYPFESTLAILLDTDLMW